MIGGVGYLFQSFFLSAVLSVFFFNFPFFWWRRRMGPQTQSKPNQTQTPGLVLFQSLSFIQSLPLKERCVHLVDQVDCGILNREIRSLSRFLKSFFYLPVYQDRLLYIPKMTREYAKWQKLNTQSLFALLFSLKDWVMNEDWVIRRILF